MRQEMEKSFVISSAREEEVEVSREWEKRAKNFVV